MARLTDGRRLCSTKLNPNALPQFREYGAEDTAGDGAPPIGWMRRQMEAPKRTYPIFSLDLDILTRTWVGGKTPGVS